MQKLSHIIRHLEQLAPPSFQESYDNSGLITGHPDMEISGALICLDSTEAVLDEAIQHGCNLIIAHHPIVFSGLKRFNGSNYVERTIIKAIKNDIAIYAIHTNLDNVAAGVNSEICKRLGLVTTRILQPKKSILKKLVTFCPIANTQNILNALFSSGAGAIGNYDECSFRVTGTGTFRGNEESNPVLGSRGVRHSETEDRIELVFEAWREKMVMEALRLAHPYEEIAFEIQSIDNQYKNVGSGMIGELPVPEKTTDFLARVKQNMKAGVVKHTQIVNETVSRIAVCGGSGSFLLADAIRAGADVFITADYKYHQFFDADGKIVIADIGHFESEQFTKELLYNELNGKFTTFALRLSEAITNPVQYL